MIFRQIARVTLIVCTLGAWGVALGAKSVHAETIVQAATSATTAQDFIEGLAEEAVSALTAEGVTRDVRISRFSELLNTNFDVKTIGKWVLGRYWRTASDEEKEAYLKLFEEYVVITYVERFDQYSGEKLKVIKAVSEPGQDSLVMTAINRPSGGDPIRVDWRVRSKADVYKIIDVYVEGISMSQTQRKEFTSVIRSQGGTVAGLLTVLRTQIAKLNN